MYQHQNNRKVNKEQGIYKYQNKTVPSNRSHRATRYRYAPHQHQNNQEVRTEQVMFQFQNNQMVIAEQGMYQPMLWIQICKDL
jgi:hypothetical protein